MLERVWRKGNLLTLLVGMQTSTATMENSVEIPLKIRFPFVFRDRGQFSKSVSENRVG